VLKRLDLSQHRLAVELTRQWARWRSWRLRHRFATELASVVVGLLVLFEGSSAPASIQADASPILELPDEWVVLAISADHTLGLELGDRVAVLAEGAVVTTSATVAEVLGDSVMVALPLEIAPVVASAASNVVLARLNSPGTAQATSSTTTPSTTR
jgi:hypothetical protein